MNQNINIVAPITDDGYYSVGYIAEQLKYFSKPFPKKIVEAAINCKNEITPKLIELLDYAYHNYELLDEEYFGHLYALFLLAEFKETKAFQIAIGILELNEDALELLLGDIITQDYPNILASLYNGDLNSIKSVIENPDVYMFARDAAIRSLLALVVEGKLEKNLVINYLESLLDHNIFRSSPEEMSFLISSMKELIPSCIDSHGKVKEIIEMGLVDSTLLDIQDLMNRSSCEDNSYELEKNYGYIKSAVDSMSWWHCFQEDKAKFMDTQSYVRGINTPIRVIKIGRNDPCPCGSGKKYKKCCLLNQ